MADPAERAENAVSILMRLVISLALPMWGLAMLLLGIGHRSPWWIGCGLATGAIGLLFFVGSPLTDPIFQGPASVAGSYVRFIVSLSRDILAIDNADL